MTPDLCIYHANCMDGFTAAWVVNQRWPGTPMHPAAYGEAPPDVAGKHVLIVDFSYPGMVLAQMVNKGLAKSVTVLDHHKTAQAELAGFTVPQFFADAEIGWDDLDIEGIRAHFDVAKSGARLASEYCFGAVDEAPLIVAYTEDRDLWRWLLPNSGAINAALGSYEQSFGQWGRLNDRLLNEHRVSTLMAEGFAIIRQRDKDIDAVIDTSWRWMMIAGHRVPVANAPFFFASDIGNKLAEGNPFAGTYYDASSGERIFSLRSVDSGADVSEIAKRYGGGGHYHAAGFKMPKGWEGGQ